MKVSYRKIKEFSPTSISATDAAAVLTATGLEIEGVETMEDIPGGLKGLVVEKLPTAISTQTQIDLDAVKLTLVAKNLILYVVHPTP